MREPMGVRSTIVATPPAPLTMVAMSFSIEPLRAHPGHVGFVADLVYREFWSGVPGGLSLDYLGAAFGGRAEPGRVLASLVALEGDVPLGCVHLIDNDDPSLPALYPWLAAMVVVPERRREGIGSALVRALVQEARNLGFTRLWLGTDGPGFYERLGARRYLQRRADFWTLVFDLAPHLPV